VISILHPGFERLRRFESGELSARSRANLKEHLQDCAECRARVTKIRALKAAIPEATSPAPPADSWATIVGRIQSGEEVILPDPGSAPTTASSRFSRKAAAAAAIFFAAGAASATVAVIGTGLGERIVRRDAAAVLQEDAEILPAAVVRSASPMAGLSASPLGGEIVIALEDADSSLVIRVRISDSEQVEVVARGEAASATFTSAPGRLGVASAAGGEVQVDIPRTVERALLAVNGMTYLIIQRGDLRVLSTSADTISGEYLLKVIR
jgi:hypothetical protein